MADWPERIEEKLDRVLDMLEGAEDTTPGEDGDEDPDDDGNNPPEPPDYEDPDDNGGDDEDDDPPANGQHPSDLIPVLKDWTIMLPTGSPGDPDNEYLVGVSIPDTYFVRDGAVVFRCYPATANHSKNSRYGRTEGRQMVPGKKWEKSSWSSSEPHQLTARLAIDTSRLAYEIVNALQIHDGGDDVAQVQVRDGVLGVSHKDGKAWEVLDPGYGGQTVDIKIEVTGGGELVFTYNGIEKARIEKTGSSWYWKAGCYPNTGGANEKRPERPDAYAEVVIYKLEVTPA